MPGRMSGSLYPARLGPARLGPVGEDFLLLGQVRPAAAGRRTGPVLAPLRAAGPAAAQSKGPMTEDGTPQPPGLVQSDQIVVVCPGWPSPQPILVTVDRHRSRP
jgi:hypothetical protein